MAEVAVVNDEPDGCEIIARVLERDGHTAHRVGSAADALALAEDGVLDVVLCDLATGGPAANRSLLEALRSGPAPEVRVLVVGRSEGAGLLAYQAEADGYLARPYHVDELIRQVDEALARPEGEREPFRRAAVAAITAG